MKHLKRNYFIFSPDEPTGNPSPQPQPTPTPQINELQARITQLERDNAELREAYDKSKNQQPQFLSFKEIVATFGKEFDKQ